MGSGRAQQPQQVSTWLDPCAELPSPAQHRVDAPCPVAMSLSAGTSQPVGVEGTTSVCSFSQRVALHAHAQEGICPLHTPSCGSTVLTPCPTCSSLTRSPP